MFLAKFKAARLQVASSMSVLAKSDCLLWLPPFLNKEASMHFNSNKTYFHTYPLFCSSHKLSFSGICPISLLGIAGTYGNGY